MDITSSNFVQHLDLIRKSIHSADFIAIDSEFSGLSIGFDDKQHDFDTIEDKYQKIKHNCQRMNAFQFGVVTFKWNSQTSSYMMRPFNFYCFPNSKLMDKKIVQFDSSTLKFLLDNNFDFNKLFKEGINYTRLSEKDQIEERMKKYLREAPEFKRFFTHLGSKSSQSLDELIAKV